MRCDAMLAKRRRRQQDGMGLVAIYCKLDEKSSKWLCARPD
jgi:hypothetical protein